MSEARSSSAQKPRRSPGRPNPDAEPDNIGTTCLEAACLLGFETPTLTPTLTPMSSCRGRGSLEPHPTPTGPTPRSGQIPLILGVDPGAMGALAVINPVTRAIVALTDVATIALGGWRLIDGAAMAAWLERNPFDRAILERVDARPTDGRGSIAAFGRNAGGLAALLTATGKPLALVTPATWKKRAGLIDQPKAASIELARLTFGAAAAERWFPLKKHDGRAEAALIALFGAGA